MAQNKIDIRRETGQNFGIKVPNRNHRFFRQYYRGPGDEKDIVVADFVMHLFVCL